jgi:hypothetical protein
MEIKLGPVVLSDKDIEEALGASNQSKARYNKKDAEHLELNDRGFHILTHSNGNHLKPNLFEPLLKNNIEYKIAYCYTRNGIKDSGAVTIWIRRAREDCCSSN